METIIGIGLVVYIAGMFVLAEFFVHINTKTVESVYAGLSKVIAERDEALARLDRAQAEIRALEDKLAKTDPWGDSQS